MRGIRRAAAGAAVAAALCTVAACGSSGGFSGGSNSSSLSGKQSGVHLQLMIGSSGDAETAAVQAAAKAWGASSGNTVQVIPASNLTQQLTQAMSGGAPPDVFYGSSAQFQSLAQSG
ncbi:MAG: extracellular solute-binding protein, partial [Actinobacteria bacterium]|nr:extracellular solute-binding protein [Actinomycetota bacterium]